MSEEKEEVNFPIDGFDHESVPELTIEDLEELVKFVNPDASTDEINSIVNDVKSSKEKAGAELARGNEVLQESLSAQTQPGRAKTFGEVLVASNPSPTDQQLIDSEKARQLCAELADLVSDASHRNGMSGSPLFNHAVGNILDAQMAAVKVIVFNPRGK